ncbi:GH1 family beta-glucosidase [soil metagenome]
MPTDLPRLPAGFRFGASTASYQIEGAVEEDGRGPSVWDTFCARPGTVVDGSSGAVACDHYHRYPEDVALMRGLGLDAYRLSVSWSRVQPDGSGRINGAGLAFYDRLVDELLAAGVQPMVTLFHWDLPQVLQDKGGWLQRDTVERFAEYATLVGLRLGDRVEHWCPVNEPNIVTMLGHALGTHAPGQQLMFDALPVAHHLNIAHGRAVAALRATGARSVGTANNHAPVWPASDSAADVAAAGLYDVLMNKLFSDPMLLGRYPEGFAELMPGPVEDDLAVISAPLDFYGVNYYSPARVADPSSPVPAASGLALENAPFKLVDVEGYPRTAFDWPVVPAGLTELLTSLRATYADKLPPILITESGCAYDDVVTADGTVPDPDRIAYLDAHLRAIGQAIEEGVDVRGYYTWSLLDNFEWAEGYTKRFGLVHVDFDTQQRTPKDSYAWYRDVIAAHR